MDALRLLESMAFARLRGPLLPCHYCPSFDYSRILPLPRTSRLWMSSRLRMKETLQSKQACRSPAANDPARFPDARVPPSFRVLGVNVNAVQIPEVVTLIERWIAERAPLRYIAVTGMHGVMEAWDDPEFRHILNHASLIVPDGMPLVWLGRHRGFPLSRRVYGPELMLKFCQQTATQGHRHFFYGAAEGVAQRLAETFARRFPGLAVAGACTPPFRPLSEEEKQQTASRINDAAADVLWVGLSTPKQERWMWEFRERLKVPVVVGVGAAFDFHTGRVPQAPPWMQENGLEWLYRLTREPRRLGRRYLLKGPRFALLAALEAAGLLRS